ncbi:recombination-associated protein RdgC [Shewanella frigidimarina]|uniref:recombination-associated protein RdgC n=1 Tax=Shewanella frigidimarina TaxID=56812 RepID=UPI003D7A6B1F
MYFKNAIVYQITRNIGLSEPEAIERLSAQLNDFAFSACNSQDVSKCGWVSPLHHVDAEERLLAGDGRVLLTLKKEEKILPAATITKNLNEKVKALELVEQRKLGKKEKDAIKDNIVQELLPRAFSKESHLSAYISIKHNLIIVDTATASQAETLLALLRKTMGSLPVVPIQSKSLVEVIMTSWLREEVEPEGFSIGNDAVLLGEGDEKVTFKGQDLFTDEVIGHIEADKQVSELRLSWGQTFLITITAGLIFKGIKWAEEFKSTNDDVGHEDVVARFDADFALMGGELEQMLLQLFEVLEIQRQED